MMWKVTAAVDDLHDLVAVRPALPPAFAVSLFTCSHCRGMAPSALSPLARSASGVSGVRPRNIFNLASSALRSRMVSILPSDCWTGRFLMASEE